MINDNSEKERHEKDSSDEKLLEIEQSRKDIYDKRTVLKKETLKKIALKRTHQTNDNSEQEEFETEQF